MTAPSTVAALQAGDSLIEELKGVTHYPAAPTMGRLQRVSYTHEDMINFILANPWALQKEIAARYGYTEGWISNILASDAFQAAMAARREEIIDPALKATIEERFRALVIQSLKVLQDKLNQPAVEASVAIRAAELGAKALGVGGHAAPKPADTSADRLERLAARLVVLQPNPKGVTYDGEVSRVEALAPSIKQG